MANASRQSGHLSEIYRGDVWRSVAPRVRDAQIHARSGGELSTRQMRKAGGADTPTDLMVNFEVETNPTSAISVAQVSASTTTKEENHGGK